MTMTRLTWTHRILAAGALAVCLALAASPAAFAQDWKSYLDNSLTIIYPDLDVARSNPPFLHWQPHERAAEYRLTLRQAGAVVAEWRTPWNFYTPAEALERGEYILEVAAADKAGESLGVSAARVFRIAGAPAMIPPPLNAISFPTGASILFTPELLADINAAADQRSEFRRRLLDYVAKPLPENLTPPREPEPYTDGTFNYDQWYKSHGLCGAIDVHVSQRALAYRLTGERAHLDAARQLMLVVAQWAPDGPTGASDNDHSAWALLHALSVGYNLLRDELTLADRQAIVAAIRARCDDMYQFLNPLIPKVTTVGLMNDADSNHSWFCAAALGYGALAVMGESDAPEASEWLSFVAQVYHGAFLPRGGRTGEWHEGIDYWSYTLYFVFQFCDALKTAAGIDLYQHPWLCNTAFYKIYTHPPEGCYLPFGDGKSQPPDGFDKLIMMRLASVYDDPLAWKYVDAIPAPVEDVRLFNALLWGQRREAAARPLPSIPFAAHFEDIGWVVSNNNVFNPAARILFAFHCGPYYGKKYNHAHADQNHFIIAAGPDRLVWDAGYYDGYLSPHHAQFSRTSLAHNTILIDGAGQNLDTGTDGRMVRYALAGTRVTAQGDASNPAIYGGAAVRFLRDVEYRDERQFTIRDDIATTGPAHLSWLLHSVYPIHFNAADNSIRITGEQFELTGVIQTSAKIHTILTHGFHVPPKRDTRRPFPDQYHLEIKTVEKISEWQPRLDLTLKRLPAPSE